MRKIRVLFLLPFLLIILIANANAALMDLGLGSFTPAATAITFSEPGYPLGTVDPVYNFTGLPGLGDMTVSFGGHFIGQSATAGYPVSLTGSPTPGPLTLDPNAPDTYIANDAAHPTTPVLTGTPLYNGPISVLFSQPVAGVGLSGGYFNGVNSTTIEAFDVNGASLGSITNSVLGIEFYGLADASLQNVIAGISFYITGNEPAGFTIDNLTFGAGEVIDQVPEPATFLLLGFGLFGLAGFGGRKKYFKK